MEVVDHNNGDWPDHCIVAVAPHTSNRDFPYGIYSRPVLGVDIHWVGKESLFKWPMGSILRYLGGVPVVRSRRTNFVQSVAEIFKREKVFRLCIAIEGTRSKVERFKTGFYFIALEAGVPIVLTRWDFGNRKLEFSKPFHPTGNIREDFDFIYRHFDGIKGLVPENSFTYDPAVLDALPEVRQ
ncbi:hypothetical protein A3850_006005 [Lewinella sp. 4G2]|nr:hypothetical protein A3850_006005 [Lewinella sp. 4G2]